MLVKINLNESPTRNQGSMVGLPTKQIHSVHGRPTELGAGKKLLLLFSFKGITLLLYYSGVRFKVCIVICTKKTVSMYNEFCFALLHGLTFVHSDVLKSNNFHYQNEDTNSFCICISFDRAVHRTSDICTVWTQGYYRCKGIIWWLFSTGWQAVSTFLSILL